MLTLALSGAPTAGALMPARLPCVCNGVLGIALAAVAAPVPPAGAGAAALPATAGHPARPGNLAAEARGKALLSAGCSGAAAPLLLPGAEADVTVPAASLLLPGTEGGAAAPLGALASGSGCVLGGVTGSAAPRGLFLLRRAMSGHMLQGTHRSTGR